MNLELENLKRNRAVFDQLLSGITSIEYTWHEREGKWSLLQVVCHLYDEEREDFRARVKSVLENPELHFSKIDPVAWVEERNYAGQDYQVMLSKFLQERDASIAWLSSLNNPEWDNAYDHPKVGPITARFLLTNWVAHDYLHIRQIIRIKYHYLQFQSGQSLDYAGEW